MRWSFFNFSFRACVYDGPIINITCLKCHMFHKINFKIKSSELTIRKFNKKTAFNLCVVLTPSLNNYLCYPSIEEACNK